MIRSLADAEHYFWGEGGEGWRLLQTPGVSVIRESMQPGCSETLHYHARARQLFYILSGEATFELKGAAYRVKENESFIIEPKSLHKVTNNTSGNLLFLLVSQPSTAGDRIDIIPYSHVYKEAIKLLNTEWLEEFFAVEAIDMVQLSDPQQEILDKGGFIFYARKGNDVIGTYSLLRKEEQVFELGKMAVTASARGLGLGNILMEHSLIIARESGITKLLLYTNSKLGPAVHLYKKYGFVEVPLESSLYKRSNMKMERVIDDKSITSL
jgi:mannose-6-phosphate isomerase-like protein (cupin superfamily)/GNAT superfamily N-acetyltransferase